MSNNEELFYPVHIHNHWQIHSQVSGSFPVWKAPYVGYIASLILIAALLLMRYVDPFLVTAPYFAIAPFGLVSVAIAFTWGVGPAFFSIVLGFIAINFFVVPNLFTTDIGRDIAICGPFLAILIIIILLVSQLATTTHRLATANQELQSASYMKDNFITRASHELRTPLTSIRGHAQLALGRLKKTQPPQSELQPIHTSLEKITTQTHHMQALIEDLLDLSSLYSGKLPLRYTSLDLTKLVLEISEDQQTFSGRSLKVESTLDSLVIQADYERIFQVVTNLMGNAVKYSPEHSLILMSLTKDHTDALFQICNDGPSLSIEDQQRIFEPFYRTPDAAAEHPGWGLGLSISREIVEQHHGQIWATSSSADGTMFSVKLPLTH